MKKNIVLIGIIGSILLIACNKSVTKYNKDFEGNWFTDTVYDSVIEDSSRSQILIDGQDGKLNNSCVDVCLPDLCGCISSQAGKAEMNSDKTQMKIGSAKGTQPLTINQEPFQDSDGKWKMEINGRVYTKQ